VIGSARVACARASWRLPLMSAALVGLSVVIGVAISAGPRLAALAVGAVAAVVFMVAIERRPEVGVAAATATMPFARHPWWDPNITVSDLIIVLTFLVWVFAWAFGRRQGIRATRAYGVYGLFVLAAGASLLFTTNPAEGLANLIELLFFVLLYLLILNTIDTPAKVWTLLGAWLAGMSVAAAYGLYHYALGTTTTEFLALNARRLVGTHMDPNFFGALLATTIVLSLALWWRVRRPAGRLAIAGALAMAAAALMLTLSRGAMVGAGVGLVMLLALTPRRWRFAVALGCAICAVSLTDLPDRKGRRSVWTLRQRLARVSASGDPNRANRMHGLYIAGVIFSQHPIFGSGLETFRDKMAPFSSRFSLPAVYSCHTAPALILAETGAVGFLLFNAFLVMVVLGVFRLARGSPNSETSVLARHFTAALVALLVVGVTIDLLYSRFVWIVLAVADGLAVVGLRAASGQAVGGGALPEPGDPEVGA
jgi:hypothetical protein